jgi:CheY-like chemotaxis protein
VLIVEDDEPIRQPLAELIRGEGYGVATAPNGKAALEWLRSNSAPGLILLDLLMPVMSGMQFLITRRSDASLKSIPVVVMTAWTSRWKDGAPNDADGVLSKPINTDQLLAIVARYCDRSLIA